MVFNLGKSDSKSDKNTSKKFKKTTEQPKFVLGRSVKEIASSALNLKDAITSTAKSVSNLAKASAIIVSTAAPIVADSINSFVFAKAEKAKASSAPIDLPGVNSRNIFNRPFGKKKLKLTDFILTKADETEFFAPTTWGFWRGILMYLFLFSIVGHWMEIPYCHLMNKVFGNIVEEDYAVWHDPLWTPYWVYGFGSAVLALTMLPLKIEIVKRNRSTMASAVIFYLIAVALCGAMECIMGWIINQPDENGVYPYWDNSELPLNIFKQAWLVNDLFLGGVALAYVWLIFPFCQKMLKLIGERAANIAFVGTAAACLIVSLITYVPMQRKGNLPPAKDDEEDADKEDSPELPASGSSEKKPEDDAKTEQN